jgi:hypothetical protein
MNAVITADIVNSTLMNRSLFSTLVNDLLDLFKEDQIEFYRGDSFQAFIKDANSALLKCVKSRLLAIQYSEGKRIDIRLSISIGNIKSNVKDIGLNMEDLFVKSGRYFDKFQNSSRRLYINCGDEDKDFTYEIIAEYVDSLLANVTAKQAKVLSIVLSGKSQVEAAKQLNVTTATVSQHVKAARYEEIESMLSKFKILTNQVQYGK